MVVMWRVYYIGAEPAIDPRLAGVELAYGQAIDVPPELAEELLEEPHYADCMGPAVMSAPAVVVSSTPAEPEPPMISDDEEAIDGNNEQ